jgi:hypothetical protein
MKLDIDAGERTPFPVDQLTQIALTKLEDDTMGRVVVRLEDPHVLDRDEWIEAIDLITGHTIAVRRADCGLGCKCAAEVKLVRYADEEEEADLPLILAMDDDYCPTSKDNRHRFAEDRTCDLCGASEEEA